MKSKYPKKIFIPNERSTLIHRIADGSVTILHCTGGFRAHKVDDSKWMLEPVLENGRVYAKGLLSRNELQFLLKNADIKAIAFESINWVNGSYNSNWMPIIPKENNHLIGPADLWSNISTNLAPANTGSKLRALKN